MPSYSEIQARTLLEAANLLVVAKPQPINKINTAIQSLTKAQGSIADAMGNLQKAAKAMDLIEPILRTKDQSKVQSIEQFRKYYGEIAAKLNDLTGSIAKVSAELMPLSTSVEPAKQNPQVPAAPQTPQAPAPAKPEVK